MAGRRYRVSGGTKAKATNNLIDRRKELVGAKPGGDIRLGGWIDWWLETVNPNPRKSPNTVAHNEWALRQLSEEIRKKPLHSLATADVEAELKRLATRPSVKLTKSTSKPNANARGTGHRSLGRASLSKVRRVLAVVLTEAQRRDMLTTNVAKLAHLPVAAAEPNPRRALSTEEGKALLTAAEKEGTWYALVAVMLYLGLRPGEVTGLPWDAVDLVEGTLTVRQSRKILPGGIIAIGPTKAHSDRVLALPVAVRIALEDHQDQQAETERTTLGWEENGLVFPSTIGRPLDASNLRRLIERLCEVAEIDPVSPNELRHTAATHLVESGMRLEDVADFLGHVDTSMLIETYRHRAKRVVDLTHGQELMYQ
jgi:integrase